MKREYNIGCILCEMSNNHKYDTYAFYNVK